MSNNEMQSCMKKLRETAEAFDAALTEAKRAGLKVVVEPDGQGVAVKCFPPGAANDHDDGGEPMIVSANLNRRGKHTTSRAAAKCSI